MAKEKAAKTTKNPDKKSVFSDERVRFVIGILITGFSLYLLLACVSYFFWWRADAAHTGKEVQNWGGQLGLRLARFIIAKGFGYGAIFFPLITGSIGLYFLNFPRIRLWSLISKFAIAAILISLILGFVFAYAPDYMESGPGGAQGAFIVQWLNPLLGKIGTGVILLVLTISYLIFALKVKPEYLKPKLPGSPFRSKDDSLSGSESQVELTEDDTLLPDEEEEPEADKNGKPLEFVVRNTRFDHNLKTPAAEKGSIIRDLEAVPLAVPDKDHVPINITKPEAGETLSEEEVEKRMVTYDPRLDLSHYKFPPVSILKEHRSAFPFDEKEVFENKENIIKTLGDHKIEIKSISATVGPTVTLYEIVPERGVRLARIKSLEDDIALNLSALGIRIIAPIPGRGTVGIEVPNKKPEMVSMRSLITSKAFQESKFDIALALGRTITNDPYIVDLTKMPHLLVAGATGQGKSVGINAIITSILYKKHPSEIKFVLIDPKRVELPLYMKIERHFLAKLPGEEDAIITDTQKVINTLKSLCIEMDNRLEHLKAAQSRNIKEYNEKFISRKLNPEKGHKYLPYIVLIIDEFADLIMTAGREIEGPIGRLAQLARAIGIHLIISTQRPSANIITGFIKANFPTRIAFRVFSSIDSRTILDATGADRLVGRGDMLVSSGSEPVRVQCAFIDTPEIEELTDFIGSQQGYPDAMHLPEYNDDSDSDLSDVDLKKRDPMFEEAARVVIQHQQGSTSLIQRKLSIGYNRAGRIIDQLEAAGIVGPFEGSKARDVLCSDMMVLEQILHRLD